MKSNPEGSFLPQIKSDNDKKEMDALSVSIHIFHLRSSVMKKIFVLNYHTFSGILDSQGTPTWHKPQP
jgi:hypothetical protein